MKKTNLFFVLAFCLAAVLLFSGCSGEKENVSPSAGNSSREGTEEPFSILVFIPNVVAGSPSYEALMAGVESAAAKNPRIRYKLFEAGFNQAEWQEKLFGLVAGGEYDLVLSSNPAVPQLCAEVAKSFPSQKFIVLDAHLPGNPAIATVLYNQYEQSVYLGYLAALVSEEGIASGRNRRRVGFVLAQDFPVANRLMVPGFQDGARMVHPDYTADLRVIGNWTDANKAAELAGSIIDAGAFVLTHVSGGAGQGVIRTAADRKAGMVIFDHNLYAAAPGTILGCGRMSQAQLAEEMIDQAMAGTASYGEAKVVGIREGYLGFIFDDPAYERHLSPEVRSRFEDFFNKLKSGEITLTTPPGVF